MEPKMANIRQGLVSTGLGLQPAEDLRWMGLLDEKRADLTLYGVVGRIGWCATRQSDGHGCARWP